MISSSVFLTGEAFYFLRGRELGEDFYQQRLELTEAGHRVLDGLEDNVTINGIDRWFGGVHMVSGEGVWRWDTRAAKLTRDKN